jgi:hypothetical protein
LSDPTNAAAPERVTDPDGPRSNTDLRVPEAVWWPTMPTYEQLDAIPLPGFVAIGLRCSGTHWFFLACRVVPRLVRHPLKSLYALARGKRPKELLRFCLWLDTARFFEVSSLREPDLSVSVFSRFLPLKPRSRPRTAEPTIAAVIITQNRSAKLRLALAAIKQLVSSVIVVDGGSTDDTESVARDAGATIVRRTFDRNFAAQRNAGISAVGEVDWVIRLDDDESFTPGLPDYLRSVLAAAAGFDSVFLTFHTYSPERWPTPATNLAALRPWLRYRVPVHERANWKRPLFCPVTAPGFENRKTFRDLLVAALLYHSIQPADFPPGFEEDATRRLAELDADDAG